MRRSGSEMRVFVAAAVWPALAFFSATALFPDPAVAVREPAGLRAPRHAAPDGQPHVIPPSRHAPAEEERHFIRERGSRFIVQVEYPSVGVFAVDQASALWCRQKLDTFISGLADIPADETTSFRLDIDYVLYRSSPNTASIIYTITTDTGGFLPRQAVAGFTYDLRTGRAVSLEEAFETGGGLPSFLSFYSRRELGRNGREADAASLHRATRPEFESFSTFALTPEGLSLFFAPDQVSAESPDVRRVDVPLTALKVYRPRRDFWPVESQ